MVYVLAAREERELGVGRRFGDSCVRGGGTRRERKGRGAHLDGRVGNAAV